MWIFATTLQGCRDQQDGSCRYIAELKFRHTTNVIDYLDDKTTNEVNRDQLTIHVATSAINSYVDIDIMMYLA
jgi:hypothetical protein